MELFAMQEILLNILLIIYIIKYGIVVCKNILLLILSNLFTQIHEFIF